METKNKEPIRVMLMAPQITAWGLQELFKSAASHFNLVASVDTLADARKAALLERPHAFVVDLDARPDRAQLLAFGPENATRVIVLAGRDDAPAWEQAAPHSLQGLVRKTDPPETLLVAIQAVSQGELWMPTKASDRAHAAATGRQVPEKVDPVLAKVETLTVRERQVMAVLALDTTSPAHVVARRLSVSVNTLRYHLKQIYSKLEVNSRLDLYAYAVRHQLRVHELSQGTRETLDKSGSPAHAASQQNAIR